MRILALCSVFLLLVACASAKPSASIRQSTPAVAQRVDRAPPKPKKKLKSICGDGIRQSGEQCDNGKKNSNIIPDACRTNCKKARCGDNVRDTNEECDAGANPKLARFCTPECKVPSLGVGKE
jgi:cysteine-rich repeat protein